MHYILINKIIFIDNKSKSIAKITRENELTTKEFKIKNIA
jgi:hypothetical protein